ncbi:MAG: DUF4851 domain-containing protein [Mailhella sp.]|nr:DUF4851 domain-containing protein [Mailhella sp.]
MKKIFLCAALAAVMMLSGCAGKVYRGLDNAGAFVSTAPVASVQPAEGFANVASGRTLVQVPIEDQAIARASAQVWYSLYKNEGSQLAVMLAECFSGWEWNISSLGAEHHVKPLLYKFYGERPADATVLVYTRLVEKDPWMPSFAAAGSAWEGESVVARYEWMSTGSREKIVAEYREPASAVLKDDMVSTEQVGAFLQRAQKAFSLGGVQEGVQVSALPLTSISDWALGPVVGSVCLPVHYERLDD